MDVPRERRSGPDFRRQGAIILGIFGCVWAMSGISGIAGGVGVWPTLAALVITVGVIVSAARTDSTRTRLRQPHPDWQRRYNVIGILEGVAIFAAIAVLIAAGVPGLIPPVVAAIVGVHFLPLASTFDQPEYRWTGSALCLVAVIGLVLFRPATDETIRAFVGIGAAVVLWVTAVIVARRG